MKHTSEVAVITFLILEKFEQKASRLKGLLRPKDPNCSNVIPEGRVHAAMSH